MNTTETALIVALFMSLAVTCIVHITCWLERREAAKLAREERQDLILRRDCASPIEYVGLKERLAAPEKPPELKLQEVEKTILDARPWLSNPPDGLNGWDVADEPDENGLLCFSTDENVEYVHAAYYTKGISLEAAKDMADRARLVGE